MTLSPENPLARMAYTYLSSSKEIGYPEEESPGNSAKKIPLWEKVSRVGQNGTSAPID